MPHNPLARFGSVDPEHDEEREDENPLARFDLSEEPDDVVEEQLFALTDDAEGESLRGIGTSFAKSIAKFVSDVARGATNEREEFEPSFETGAARASTGAMPQGAPAQEPLQREQLQRGAMSPTGGISALPDREPRGILEAVASETTQAVPGTLNFLRRNTVGSENLLRGISSGFDKLGPVGAPGEFVTGKLADLHREVSGAAEAGRDVFPEPETLYGKTLRFAGDFGPEIGTFVAAGQGAINQLPKGAGILKRMAASTAANAPLDAAVGASGEGGVQLGAEALGQEDAAQFLAEHPIAAATAEVALGGTFEGGAELLGAGVRFAPKIRDFVMRNAQKIQEHGDRFTGQLAIMAEELKGKIPFRDVPAEDLAPEQLVIKDLVEGRIHSAVRFGDQTLVAPDPLGERGLNGHLHAINQADADIPLGRAESGYMVEGEWVSRDEMEMALTKAGFGESEGVPAESINMSGLAQDLKGSDEAFVDIPGVGKRPVPRDRPKSVSDAISKGYIEFDDDGALQITELGKRANFAVSELGFMDRRLMSVVARGGVGGALGGTAEDIPGIEALPGDIEDAPLPVRIGVGMAFGVGAPHLARAIAKPFVRMREAGMQRAVREVVENERVQIERLINEGTVFPDQLGIPAGIERSVPKNVDVNEVTRRLVRRIQPESKKELRQMFDIVRELEDTNTLTKKSVSNRETRRLAEHIGLDPSKLREVANPDARVQTVRAMMEIDQLNKMLADLRQKTSRVQGRVPDEQFRGLLAEMDRIEQDIGTRIEQLVKAKSEIGRALQAQQINMLGRHSFSPNNASPWILQARRLSKDKLAAGDIERIMAILENGSIDDMRKFMQEMNTKGQSWGEKYATLVKAGLLSAPKTDVLNMVSTLTHMGVRMLEDPIAAVADRLISMRTGQRSQSVTLNLADRQVALVDGLRMGWHGDEEMGFRGFKQILRGGGLGQEALSKYDFRGFRTGRPLLDAYVNIAFNRLGAEDAMMKGFYFTNALQERARVHVLNSTNLKPGTRKFRDKVNNVVSEAPDWLAMQAMADAEVATFTNISDVGDIVNRAKNAAREKGGVTAAGAELLVPFVNTLVNVGAAFGRRAPGSAFGREKGFWAPLVKMIATGDISKAEQRELSRIIAEQGTGAGLVFAGFKLREQGKMTGAFPSDSDNRNAYIESNIQPFAVTGKAFGDTVPDEVTIAIENVSPIGNLLGLGAQFYDVVNNPDVTIDGDPEGVADFEAIASGQFFSFLHQLSDMTFATSVSSALEAVTNPEMGAQEYMENLGRMHVPTIVRQVAAGVDPTLRRTEGLFSAMQSGVPGASRGLEPKISGLGGPRQRDPGGLPSLKELANVLESASTLTQPSGAAMFVRDLGNVLFNTGVEGVINPFRIERSQTGTDPVLRKLADLGVGVPRLTTVQRREIGGEMRTLLENTYGRVLRRALEGKFADPDFQRLDEEAQREEIESFISSVRGETTTMFEEEGLLPRVEEERFEDPVLESMGNPDGDEENPLSRFGG